MIKIAFLGTGSMQPTKERNHSAILLRYESENILLDCGEGTQRQMRLAGLKPARVTRLLISHWHGDHVFGLPGLLSAMGADRYVKKLMIYGPSGSKKYLQHLLKSFAIKNVIDFEVKEVHTGVFFENDEFRLETRPLEHSAACQGYIFQEKDRRKIDLKKAKKLGLSGIILGRLQRGETVTVSGKKISADQVTYLVSGKKISYIADTGPCTGANELAKTADLLISEGTHLDDLKSKTKEFRHLTVKQAAEIARKNKAKRLIITHLSARYKNQQELLKEAQKYFQNSTIAEDFMEVDV